MRVHSFINILSTFVVLSGVTNASRRHETSAKRETNADRLARGLNPLQPRSLFNPSEVQTAQKAKRSPNAYYSCPANLNPTCCPDTTTYSNTQAANVALSYSDIASYDIITGFQANGDVSASSTAVLECIYPSSSLTYDAAAGYKTFFCPSAFSAAAYCCDETFYTPDTDIGPDFAIGCADAPPASAPVPGPVTTSCLGVDISSGTLACCKEPITTLSAAAALFSTNGDTGDSQILQGYELWNYGSTDGVGYQCVFPGPDAMSCPSGYTNALCCEQYFPVNGNVYANPGIGISCGALVL